MFEDFERQYIQENTNVVSFIEKKYGVFNDETFFKFIKYDYTSGRKDISDNDAERIIYEIKRLLDYQNLKYRDLVFLGRGQAFSVLQVGDAVVKVGHTLNIDYEEYNLPPIFECTLRESKASLYVSQRANGRKATKEDVIGFYKMIKDMGGLWLDPKENNLGFVDKPLNFSGLYKVNYELTSPGPYLLDYEDVVTERNFDKEELLSTYGSPDDRKHLFSESRMGVFLYCLFVRKRNNLLSIERELAIREGRFDYAHSYEVQQNKNLDGKTDYYSSDYYEDDKYNYPKSNDLIKRELKYKVMRAFRPKEKEEGTKKHR